MDSSILWFSYASLLLIISHSLPCLFLSSATTFTSYIFPNFTASYLDYIDESGAFLFSRNRTFAASFNNFYFSVIHVPTNTIIWSANRDRPMSESGTLFLTPSGLTITGHNSTSLIWTTPPFKDSNVSALGLEDSGNLVLLDQDNNSLWNSFDYPTDTIVIGQRLAIGTSLDGAVSNTNLSSGDYRLVLTSDDAVLRWKGINYWPLSTSSSVFKDSNVPVSFMAVNATGLHLFGSDGTKVVYQMRLVYSDFRRAKLESDGQFNVNSLQGDQLVTDFVGLTDVCQIPAICGKLGLCANGTCSCPKGLPVYQLNSGCEPAHDFLSLPYPSDCNESGPPVTYLKLDQGIDYFSNSFLKPLEDNVSLSACQDLCSRNCSCLGVFHGNLSGSCYLLENDLGSVFSTTVDEEVDRLGYIKAITTLSGTVPSKRKGRKLPVAGFLVLVSFGFLLLIVFFVMGFLWWRRKRIARKTMVRLGSRSLETEDMEMETIPGLPRRFNQEELAVATENFKNQIGSGGFGTVFRGTLPDNTIVAVKKIKSLGVQGKREFYAEIATIGRIRHLNLVRLKGFCVLGSQRFLVYEYMSKGSLNYALFGPGPVLGWRERYEIALGTAKGLAYLHTGCEEKIIHCDIKPENILLHDNLQVKISDFGLSKLLSPEQSNRITTLRGTRGYLAPEWLTSSTITDKSDVYSYGMVLLEIVTGRRNCTLLTQSLRAENASGNASGEGSGLSSTSSGSEWRVVYFPSVALKMHEQKRYLELVDPRLDRQNLTSQEVEKLVCIALCCLHQEPTARPSMTSVVRMLEGRVLLAEPRIEFLSFLRWYGGRPTETFAPEGRNQDNDCAAYNSAINGNFSSEITPDRLSGPR